MSSFSALLQGTASGEVLMLEEPLSFWGGVDPQTGRIIEPRHPQHGESVAGRIVAMPHGRGSSSASAVLTETLRNGRGPAGIVLQHPDSILVVGALVARELYGVVCPVVVSDVLPGNGEVWSIAPDGLAPV